jgi:hypothetical protein
VVQVFHLNTGAFSLHNTLRVVASIAGEPSVLAGEWITRLAVIEFARCSVPLDDVEVLAEMVGMAARAVFPAVGLLDDVSMKPPASGQPLPNLGMTAQALEAWRPGPKNVAGCALGWTTQAIMRA